MKSLFIFESHPVQYHAPVYRELHRLCTERGGARIHIFYGTKGGHFDPGFGAKVTWDDPLLEGYPTTVLENGRGDSLRDFSSLSGRGIIRLLRRERPNVILLTKLRHAFDWTAYLGALFLRIPIWLRTETQDHAFARSRLKSLVRFLGYKLAYAPVRRALTIGQLNSEHYTRHGIPPDRQSASPYCVVDRFSELAPSQNVQLRASHRRLLGIQDDTTLLLFCGKLQPKKRPDLILDALSKFPSQVRRKFAVVFVGTGELQDELRRLAIQLPEVAVLFAGFKNQRELPPWYLASDVLILPSQQMGETWGLVANEALLAERRVVLSRHAGCHKDFSVLPSVRVFDGSSEDLAKVLLSLPGPASTHGQREFMRNYSVETAAEGIARALGVARKGASESPFDFPPELNLASANCML